jgi:hypothetical protein
MTAADIDCMISKPSLWVLASGTFALLAVVAYLIFALPLADHMKSDLVPPDNPISYVHALIEANRISYAKNVVDTLDKTGLPTPSRIVKTKMAFLCLHSSSWSQDALSLKTISRSRSGSQV